MFEIKDYGVEVNINDNIFNVDLGNIEFIEKLSEIQTTGLSKIEDLKTIKDIQGTENQVAFAKEKAKQITDWINSLLCDTKAVDKILGDKKNSIKNIVDLFVYTLNTISNLEINKLDEKTKEYEPIK